MTRVTSRAQELRSDEQFVMAALCQKYAAASQPGENPPDAYLMLGRQKIAVEVSSLVQHMHDGKQSISRQGIDLATLELAPELQDQLGSLIPDGFGILVGLLHTPLRQFRKTKSDLQKVLPKILPRDFNALSAPYSCQLEIQGNPIAVYIDYHGDTLRPKVDTYSISGGADLGENTCDILRDRIEVKQQKCQAAFATGPVWLALFNHYWLANAETYSYALSRLGITHNFDAIVIVSETCDVDPIYMNDRAKGND